MMSTALCSNRYNERCSRNTSERLRTNIPWATSLPSGWRDLIVRPVEFQVFREYEMEAERTTGQDEDGLPCYCAHRVRITDLRSDDDEEYYPVVTYAEQLCAWRLRDGRWLIHRQISTGDDCAGRSFYSFSAEMPR